jgi:hypothetical protein
MEEEIMTSLFHRAFPVSEEDWFRRIKSFPDSIQGHSVAFQSTGYNALLFSYQESMWVWTPDTGMTHHCTISGSSPQLFVFVVEVGLTDLFLVDTFIYANHSVLSRDYLERMEVARRWIHDHPVRVESKCKIKGMEPFRSAYLDYEILVDNFFTMRCRQLFPGHCAHSLWQQRHTLSFAVDGLLFNRLLCSQEAGLLCTVFL